MTMHAVVLPGYQPYTLTCGYCPADFGLVSRPVPLLREWEGALRDGPAAIDAYLARHNAQFIERHDPGCPFRELPPAVHATCSSWEQLLQARRDLDNARARGDRPAD
ncbi:hypothetical protein [Streptomyces canus]|uniref:hypothetical protein n=1 Tax=Streptomyces canus TaxID=58343 RepID=UPI0036EFF3B9